MCVCVCVYVCVCMMRSHVINVLSVHEGRGVRVCACVCMTRSQYVKDVHQIERVKILNIVKSKC